MTILATFIGIDKHLDPDIPDLTGARRDALALWALFSDTISEIQGRLLTDNEATVDAIRGALDETLGVAGSDDVVILSFSGHGTKDHRLVASDTARQDLTGTTIPMAELSERFKKSKAKAILCILDCCFSGGAPARVLEDSPTARDPAVTLQELAGKGRILIAAANIKELAYELPNIRHGILTKALMDVFQSLEGPINVSESMGPVMERVRAEAARIGIVQTPVMFGYVEGGFTIPQLRPGKLFYSAFPEATGVKITQALQDLSVFGLPIGIIDEWAQQFRQGLNQLQLEAVNEYRILNGKSLLVVAPTSSGKTFIGELAALRAITESRKAVFLLPYKALVNEKYDQFLRLYKDKLGIRVIRCTGDRLDETTTFVKGKYDLALLTYEMFLGLALSFPALLNQIGLIVLDEGQFITDPTRGITVELILTYLITARERSIEPQLIVLSAVIGNVNGFDEWLGCRKLITTIRPVPLVEGVLDRSGTFQYLDASGQSHTEQLLPPNAIRQRRDKPSSQDVIVPLVRKLLAENDKEQIIVFRNMKGSAEGCAAYLADDLGLLPAQSALESLPTHDLSTSSARLRRCLQGGTAFHNTHLFPEEKEVIERAFRNPEGQVRVLGATTTVAAGINTPASTVILAEQEFVGDDGRPFTVAEYKNMAGRAGRLGFNEEGRAIILANNPYERVALFQRYVLGDLDPLRSSFDPAHLQTWILRLLAQVGTIPRKEVSRLLANTYGGYLAIKEHPEWQNTIESLLNELLSEMISLNLIGQERQDVRLTLLGQVCGRSSLLFSSVVRLINLLEEVQNNDLTAERLAALIQGLPELDRAFTPIAKAGRKTNRTIFQTETGWPREAAQVYGPQIVHSLQRNADDFFQYYARCKRALVLAEWVRGTPIEVIEQKFTANAFNAIGYGHVRSFADTTRFQLRAAHQIATVMLIDKGPSEDAIETLIKQLEVGLPAEALELLSVPITLTRGEYLTLYRSGVKTLEGLWKLSNQDIETLIGNVRTKQLENLRPHLKTDTF
jgi:replicative superfamily II helicase